MPKQMAAETNWPPHRKAKFCSMIMAGETTGIIGKEFGVRPRTVTDIRRRMMGIQFAVKPKSQTLHKPEPEITQIRKRRCIHPGCGREFVSAHFGIRKCTDCRRNREYETAPQMLYA